MGPKHVSSYFNLSVDVKTQEKNSTRVVSMSQISCIQGTSCQCVTVCVCVCVCVTLRLCVASLSVLRCVWTRMPNILLLLPPAHLTGVLNPLFVYVRFDLPHQKREKRISWTQAPSTARHSSSCNLKSALRSQSRLVIVANKIWRTGLTSTTLPETRNALQYSGKSFV